MENSSFGGHGSDFWAAKLVQLLIALAAVWIVLQIEDIVDDPARTGSNLLWYVLAFIVAMLGIISLGYFLLNWNKPKADPLKEVSPARPRKQSTAANDNLTRIEGVGPKIAELLAAAGYTSFEALATARPKDLKAVLDEGGSSFKMHSTKSWPEQAQLAADGEWDKLEELQDRLSGGR